MILKDIFGKKVNVSTFTVEADRTIFEGKLQPVISLVGKYSYISSENVRTKHKTAILKRLVCNEQNIEQLLDTKDKLEEQRNTISSQMHKEIGVVDIGIQIGKEQEWLVEHGYMFYEKDELHFPKTTEDAMNWVLKGKLPGQEEPEP